MASFFKAEYVEASAKNRANIELIF